MDERRISLSAFDPADVGTIQRRLRSKRLL
jgi:hypothetical protein